MKADWKPIETSPKDRPILVVTEVASAATGNRSITVVEWRSGCWQLTQVGGYASDGDPAGDPVLWDELPEIP